MTHEQAYMPFEGAQLRRDLSQFYTPAWLAERLWRWMARPHSAQRMTVLEPSAGRGALITPLFTLGLPVRELVAYDVDPRNVATLLAHLGPTGIPHQVRERDFVADPEPGRFDMCCMNPPFEGNRDVAFASRALDCCTWVAGVFAARILHSKGRAEFWRWTDIRRMAVLSERPQFGGDFSPMTDFVVLELGRRSSARKQGEASTTATEWW